MKTQAIAIEEQSQKGIVDVETLAKTNEDKALLTRLQSGRILGTEQVELGGPRVGRAVVGRDWHYANREPVPPGFAVELNGGEHDREHGEGKCAEPDEERGIDPSHCRTSARRRADSRDPAR